jgi:hypothetical protein
MMALFHGKEWEREEKKKEEEPLKLTEIHWLASSLA